MGGPVVTIACFANSWKNSGRCVAGRVFGNGRFGAWVRPVSARPTRELNWPERACDGVREPRVLDVLQVALARPEPELHQTENHLIDPSRGWRHLDALPWSVALGAAERPRSLWLDPGDGPDSKYGGNDRVPQKLLSNLSRSLSLIHPEQLDIVVQEEPTEDGMRRRIRADFIYGDKRYILRVTDAVFEGLFRGRPLGVYPIREALLCVSLGEVFHGYAYKLVAAVITP